MVGALPSTDPKVHIHVNHDVEDYNKARPVSAAMIREDVWQILVNTPIDSWHGNYNIDSFKSEALRALEGDLAKAEELKVAKAGGDESRIFRLAMRMNDDFDINPRENVFRGSIRGSEGVSGFSFREAFRFGIEQGTSPEELRAYILDLAETVYVQWVYSVLHGQWHPTTNSGQEGNWKEHRQFLTSLLEIKGRWENASDESDEGEDDDSGPEE